MKITGGKLSNDYEIIDPSGFKAEIKDIVLDADNNVESRITRKVIKAKIVDNADKSIKRVNITLAHQRRHKKADAWQDADSFALTSIKGGEEAKIHLDAKETYELFTALQDLYAISATGVPDGKKGIFIVHRKIDGVSITEDVLKQFVEFIEEGGEKLWEAVAEAKMVIPAALAHHRILELRQSVVKEFEKHIDEEDWDENHWQKFFSCNDWIFGHGLSYNFLTTITDQPYYGGKNVTGKDGQRGDYLLATQADARFTVLVEIKRPDTSLLAPKKYRNKVFHVSDELAGAMSQMQSNCRTWTIDGAKQEDNIELLEGIYTYQPKGILVVGNTSELNNDSQKRACFELFRRNLQSPEILTFDELLARARFLVSHQLENSEGKV